MCFSDWSFMCLSTRGTLWVYLHYQVVQLIRSRIIHCTLSLIFTSEHLWTGPLDWMPTRCGLSASDKNQFGFCLRGTLLIQSLYHNANQSTVSKDNWEIHFESAFLIWTKNLNWVLKNTNIPSEGTTSVTTLISCISSCLESCSSRMQPWTDVLIATFSFLSYCDRCSLGGR